MYIREHLRLKVPCNEKGRQDEKGREEEQERLHLNVHCNAEWKQGEEE